RKDGFAYDLGPHNIHSSRDSVLRFLKGMLGDDFIEHEFNSEIYFRRKRIKYPFEGHDIFGAIPIWTAMGCGMSFLATRIRTSFMRSYPDDGSYRTWIINRFGRRFYDIFFGPYSEKVWGIPPAELSKVIAEKRISVRGLIELIHSILFGVEQYHPENPRLQKNYYPREGVGMIADKFTNEIKQHGGNIITGAVVKCLGFKDGKINEIGFEKDGRKENITIGANDYMLSTVPLNEMVLMIDGAIPEEVREAAQKLDFTSEVFLYMNVNR
ncbi:unnamed protein product, partial [marine sediment metagenome]